MNSAVAELKPITRPDMLALLTPAERLVVLYLCEGYSNKEIADALGKSAATVKFQLTQIYRKLDVHSRTRLLALLRS